MLRSKATYPAGSSRNPKQAQELLTAIAQSSKNKELKSSFEAYLSLTPQMRSSLLSAIEIIDRSPSIVDLSAIIEDALRIFAPKGKSALAREMLEGWWWPRVCAALIASPVERIAIASLESKFDDIRELLKREALVVDYEHAEPSDVEEADLDTFRFVTQLKVIGVGGNRVRFAKRDFYRAFAQRSKWTREHTVLDEELNKFEATLIEEWQPRFASMCDGIPPEDDELAKKAAQGVYDWVEMEARFPFRSLSARFLSVGSYHILANNLRVGWHRDYLALCKEA